MLTIIPLSPQDNLWAVSDQAGQEDLIRALSCVVFWVCINELWKEVQGPSVQT